MAHLKLFVVLFVPLGYTYCYFQWLKSYVILSFFTNSNQIKYVITP